MLVILAGLALPASGGDITATVQVTNGSSFPQGLPVAFKVVVHNGTSETQNVNSGVFFRGGGDQVTVASVFFVIPPGSDSTFNGRFTPSRWVSGVGPFRLIAGSVSFGRVSDGFTVTKATVRVPRFVNMAEAAGVMQQTHLGPACTDYSAGAAWADVNGDGKLDLYVPDQTGPAHLWINNGDGTFTDQASSYGVTDDADVGIAANFADYDNDGKPDLTVVNDGPLRLFHNNGDGTFSDVTQAAGITYDGPGSSASWGDYDGDGFIDLYVAAHTRCDYKNTWKYFPDVLYHNDGDGTFTDVTALLPGTGGMGAGFEGTWFDYNHDGRLDLFLANDFAGPGPQPNALYRNDGSDGQGGWTFTDVSQESGTALSINTMGVGIADYDRDGRMDMALSNIRDMYLMHNNGDGTFTNKAVYARVDNPTQRGGHDYSVTWGLAFYDFNADGWEDLYTNAGSLNRVNAPTNQPNFVQANGHNGRFLELSAPSGANDPAASRGAAFADYDRDGREDLFVVNQDGMPDLYRNVTNISGEHWLEVRTVGGMGTLPVTDPAKPYSNRDGCGAWVTATLPSGAKLVREVFCGSTSLGAGSDPTLYFGLGTEQSVKTLRIEWPSGIKQTLRNLKVDRLMKVNEPARQ